MRKGINIYLSFGAVVVIASSLWAFMPRVSSGTLEDGIWLSLEEAEKRCKKKPKKIYVDIYTDWCGPCKQMAKTTLKDESVIKRLKKDYYAVKLNAESTESITFKGKTYKPSKPHPVVYALMGDRKFQGYPTSLFLDENFDIIQVEIGLLSKQRFNDALDEVESTSKSKSRKKSKK